MTLNSSFFPNAETVPWPPHLALKTHFTSTLPFWFCRNGYQHPPHCDEITRNSAERENEIPQRKVNFPSDVTLLPFERMVLPPGSSRLPCTLPRGHEEQKCFFCPLHLFCVLRPHES